MTRPKADSDPWLTDPIARDRVVAGTVVKGIRQIIVELRNIRDDLDESISLRNRLQDLEEDFRDFRMQVGQSIDLPAGSYPTYAFEPCEQEVCSLPRGHRGNHRARRGSGS
jgi:hypothetical protein